MDCCHIKRVNSDKNLASLENGQLEVRTSCIASSLAETGFTPSKMTLKNNSRFLFIKVHLNNNKNVFS